jgi:5-methylcytosine-specific restriction endonuclease McrA
VKRSPLRRKTKLHLGKTRLRRTALRRVGKRREREAEALAKFQNYRRDGYCQECGNVGYVEAHHACPRSIAAGHPNTHSLRNRILLCAPCHRDAHEGRRPHLIRSRDSLDALG